MSEENITLQGLNQRFDDLMVFLMENVATKEDLKQFATKDDLFAMRVQFDGKLESMESRFDSRLESMESRFDSKLDLLRNDLIQEIRSVRQEVESLRRDVERLEKRITEDSDVFASDIVQLKERVTWLEKKVKQLA